MRNFSAIFSRKFPTNVKLIFGLQDLPAQNLRHGPVESLQVAESKQIKIAIFLLTKKPAGVNSQSFFDIS
jgi:hypothetical protein